MCSFLDMAFAAHFLQAFMMYHTFCRIIAGMLRVGKNGVVGFFLT
jgi:hypothetical protein